MATWLPHFRSGVSILVAVHTLGPSLTRSPGILIWICVAWADGPTTGLTNVTWFAQAPLGRVRKAKRIRLFSPRKGRLILKALNTVYMSDRPVTLNRIVLEVIQLFRPMCPATMTLSMPVPTLMSGEMSLDRLTVLTRVPATP